MPNAQDARTLQRADTVADFLAWFGLLYFGSAVIAGYALAKEFDFRVGFVVFLFIFMQAVIFWAMGLGLRIGRMVVERLDDIAITARSAKGLIVTAQARQRAGQDSG